MSVIWEILALLPGASETDDMQGFKMVLLTVPQDCERFVADEPSGSHLPLRSTGLWYPSVPASHLCLHDDSFACDGFSLLECRPLVHVMFGGPRGAYLKHLVGISIVVNHPAIVGIEFAYSGEDAPFRILRACHSTAATNNLNEVHWSVDGPGGERLTGMQVCSESKSSRPAPHVSRYIKSLKVSQGGLLPVVLRFRCAMMYYVWAIGYVYLFSLISSAFFVHERGEVFSPNRCGYVNIVGLCSSQQTSVALSTSTPTRFRRSTSPPDLSRSGSPKRSKSPLE
jgi:hypothetical protein